MGGVNGKGVDGEVVGDDGDLFVRVGFSDFFGEGLYLGFDVGKVFFVSDWGVGGLDVVD